jgi:hypothetical protein
LAKSVRLKSTSIPTQATSLSRWVEATPSQAPAIVQALRVTCRPV